MSTAMTAPSRWIACGTSVPLVVLLALCSIACGSIDEPADAATTSQHDASLEAPCGPNPSLTPQSLLDRLDDSYDTRLAADDETPATTLRLDISYDGGDHRCVEPTRTDASARLELPVTLVARTDDGRLDASFPGTVSVLADSDQVRFSGTTPLSGDTVSPSTRSDSDRAADRLLVEGWIATDRRDFQGAVRLLREQDRELRHHRTVVDWGVR